MVKNTWSRDINFLTGMDVFIEAQWDYVIGVYLETRLVLPEGDINQADAALKMELREVDDWDCDEKTKSLEKIIIVEDLIRRLKQFLSNKEEYELTTMMEELTV